MTVRHLNPWLNERPEEAKLVSTMLAGYAELEFDISLLVGRALNNDMMGTRLIYRLRSESHRLEIADAVLHPTCAEAKLSGPYSAMYGAVKWCKNMRNTYAHCHWAERNGRLCYFALEDTAKASENEEVTLRPVSLPLLTAQALYFHYASDWISYVGHHLCKAKGAEWSLRQIEQKPKQLAQPKLHTLQT